MSVCTIGVLADVLDSMDEIIRTVLRWTPEQYRLASSTVGAASRRFGDISDRLAELGHLSGWDGVAADAARTALAALAVGVSDSIADADAIRDEMSRAADEMDPLWRSLLTGNLVGTVFGLVAAQDVLVARLDSIDPDGDSLDGLSAAQRDSVNRGRIVTERARLEAVAAYLRDTLNHNVFGGVFSNADAGLEQTEKRLQALNAIEDVLARGGRQLLVLDNSSSEETVAAIAVGDVDSASDIAVFVPGLGSTVEGSIGKYDAEVDGVVTDDEAGVVWLGYQAPQLGWDLLDPGTSVLSRTGADVAGERLSSFLAELPDDRHVTVVGHSYGSVAVAQALQSGVRVDDVVLMGSPGTTASTAADLGADNVYVLEAPTDPVADTAWFGRDPNLLPGARILAADGATGHGQYLEQGTVSAANVAAVISGAPTTAARPTVDAGAVLRVLLGLAF